MSSKLDHATILKAYARWAPIYDLVFGPVFTRGRSAAVAAADRLGDRILEVGVGTGISLPGYDRRRRVVGIDLSEPMLRKARDRASARGLGQLDGLAVMDGQRLGFRDGVFDAVVAQYVITVVPDPEAALDEFARVLRPGGEIILVNHIGAEAGLRRIVEDILAPVAARLGWRPGFQWNRLSGWAERHKDFRLIERRSVPPFGHFSLIRFVKHASFAQHELAAAIGVPVEAEGRRKRMANLQVASQGGLRAGQDLKSWSSKRPTPTSNGERTGAVSSREQPARLIRVRRRDKR